MFEWISDNLIYLLIGEIMSELARPNSIPRGFYSYL